MLTDSVPTILLVEDVEEIRGAAEKLLTADGNRVVPARDEEDAVMRAIRQPLNLLLVNLAGSGSRLVSYQLLENPHAKAVSPAGSGSFP